MSAFRGKYVRPKVNPTPSEPRSFNNGFSVVPSEIPNSFEYDLQDLLASGNKVGFVDTQVVHDPDAINRVVDSSDPLSPSSNPSNNE